MFSNRLLLLLAFPFALYAQAPSPIALDPSNGFTQSYATDAAVTPGQILKLSATGRVIPVTVTDTSSAYAIAVSQAQGPQSTIVVSLGGTVQVLVDGPCSVGQFVIISTTQAGSGHCVSTATQPSVGMAVTGITTVGRVYAQIRVNAGGGGGGGGGGSPGGANTAVQVNSGGTFAGNAGVFSADLTNQNLNFIGTIPNSSFVLSATGNTSLGQIQSGNTGLVELLLATSGGATLFNGEPTSNQGVQFFVNDTDNSGSVQLIKKNSGATQSQITLRNTGIAFLGTTNTIPNLQLTSSAAHSVLLGEASSNIASTAPSGNSQCFMSAPGSFATTDPSFQSCPGGGVPAFPQAITGGISGGIPYFSSTIQLSPSALLPTGNFVLGGGAGSAPTATFSIVPIANGGTGLATQTANIIYKGNGTSAEAVSSLTDNGTTVTSSDTGGYSGTGYTSTGGTNGFHAFTVGSGLNGHAAANTVTLEAPSAVTSYEATLPAAAANGLLTWTNASNVVTESITAIQGTDSKILSSGTISGTGVVLCTDANGGGTTAGCSGGAGSVTSIATTAPITGGPITTTGTIACATCVTSSSPGVGIAHFAGSTQAVTSSTIVAADLAAQYSKGQCTEVWGGSGTSFAMTAGDDAIARNGCYNDSGVTRTITALKCRSDNAANTTVITPTFGSTGTGTAILTGTLTCGNSYAYSSTGTLSSTAWTTGTGIAPGMSTAGNATSIAMVVEYTY